MDLLFYFSSLGVGIFAFHWFVEIFAICLFYNNFFSSIAVVVFFEVKIDGKENEKQCFTRFFAYKGAGNSMKSCLEKFSGKNRILHPKLKIIQRYYLERNVF